MKVLGTNKDQPDCNHHQTCKFKGVAPQPTGDIDHEDCIDDDASDGVVQCGHEVTTTASPRIETPEAYMIRTHSVNNAIMEGRAHTLKKSHEDDSAPGWLIHSARAEFFFAGVIVTNAILLGFETDYRNSSDFMLDWFLVEFVFLVIFTVELIMRLVAERRKFVSKYWNLFDAFLVTTGILNTAILTPVLLLDVIDDSQFNVVNVFQVIRLARLARILRILKVLRFFRELMILMRSIAGTMRSIVWSLLLLLLVLYVAAIFMTKLVGKDDELADHEKTQRYFGSMVKTMFTLYQLITLEGWNEVSRDMMAADVLGFSISIFFIMFVMFTNLTLLNLITGIIFETVVKISNEDEERDKIELREKAQLECLDTLQEAFRKIDVNQDGVVTLNEFRDSLRAASGTLQTELKRLGVGALSAEELFILLDYNNSGTLTSREFVFGFRQALGSASAKQVLGTHGVVHKMWDSTNMQSCQCSESIESLEKRLGRVEVLMEQFLAVSTVRKNRLAKAEVLFRQVMQKNPPNSVILPLKCFLGFMD